MSNNDHDHILSKAVYHRIVRRHGFIALICPTCRDFMKVGQRIFSKPKKTNGVSGYSRRHYSCAEQVNLV